MVRTMCGRKVVDRKTTPKQMNRLELKEIADGLAKTNEMNPAHSDKGNKKGKN